MSFYGDSNMQMSHSLTHSLTHSLRCRHCRSGNKSSRTRSSNHALIGRGFVIVYTRHCCFKYHLPSEQNLSSSSPNLKVRIASIVNSIIICRHWGLDQSVADHKKKTLCSSDKRKLVEFVAADL